jgi:hypothetical protein
MEKNTNRAIVAARPSSTKSSRKMRDFPVSKKLNGSF